MSWESPIGVYTTDVQHQIEGEILRVIQNLEVVVDKEELLRALQYDREQYDRGYADGYMDGERDLVRCWECQFNVANMNPDPLDMTDYSDITCSYFMTDGMCSDDFCSKGERRNNG